MAHNLTLAAASTNALADALAVLCDGGTLNVYDGSQPADPDTAVTDQTLLVTCTFASPAFSAASGGVATAHAIAEDDAADASGTAVWFRVLDSSGDPVMDGSVGVGSGYDCNVGSTAVTAGAPFPIASMTITMPAA
jgi:hypothetical protein